MADTAMTNERYEEFVGEKFSDADRAEGRIVFTNRGPFHARVVMSQMFAHARRSLDIVSNCLRDNVFDGGMLRDVCRRATTRVILTDAIPLRGPSALAHLRREVEEGLIQVRGKAASGYAHFAIADGRHVRSEKDQLENTAVVVLNAHLPPEEEYASGYARYFEYIWAQATPYVFDELFPR